MFLIYIFTLILLGLIWWRVMDRRLKTFKHAALWRMLLAAFMITSLSFPIAGSFRGNFFPAFLPAAGWMWLSFGVTTATAWLVLIDPSFFLLRWLRRRKQAMTGGIERPVNLSRRRAMAAVVPPLLAGGLTGVCMEELGEFRVRRLEVSRRDWPAELDGFAIALVADVHTGPFTTQKMLDQIVQQTNTIHNGGPADLVVLGGDLINTTLHDLPQALDMAVNLRGRLGTYAILGNHDVMDSRPGFIDGVRQAGIPLLLEDVVTISPVPGVAFQLLGVDWALDDQTLFQSVRRTCLRRDPTLFSLCLAHHPHAWDAAVDCGLPLTLSAHTHGGQIMLTKNIGAGPIKFRYWSGVHERNGSTLAITNGVGDWFPLRVNAPAEILKVVVRSGVPSAT